MAFNRSPFDGSGEPSRELHVGVLCDGCDRNIYGARFKCATCPDYDLCSVCANKGFHQEHDLIEISSPVSPTRPEQLHGVLHPGIECDGCDVNIRGIRYQCNICPDYDLCSICKGKGFHKEHDMTVIRRPATRPKDARGVLHPGVWCDGCGINIRGTRFKCTICPDFDLCSVCEGNKFHHIHDMMGIRSPVAQAPQNRPEQLQGVLHPGIWCDGCGVNIRGIRYRCRTCPDYDLCSVCEGSGFHNEHNKVKIQSPTSQVQPRVAEESQGELHPGIYCDGCDVNIRGIRFKCRICPDYDLCSICQNSGLHQEHTMIQIENPRPIPGQLHPGVRCNSCDGEIRGIRHKCPSCNEYDLCSSCRNSGVHQIHQMLEIKSPSAHLPSPFLVETRQQSVHTVPAHGQERGETESGSRDATEEMETQGSDEVADSEDAMTCGICFERKKESFIIPCGHTLCCVCAVAMENTENKLCPFCRKKIQSIGKIYF